MHMLAAAYAVSLIINFMSFLIGERLNEDQFPFAGH